MVKRQVSKVRPTKALSAPGETNIGTKGGRLNIGTKCARLANYRNPGR